LLDRVNLAVHYPFLKSQFALFNLDVGIRGMTPGVPRRCSDQEITPRPSSLADCLSTMSTFYDQILCFGDR